MKPLCRECHDWKTCAHHKFEIAECANCHKTAVCAFCEAEPDSSLVAVATNTAK